MFQVKSVVNDSMLKGDKVYDVYAVEGIGNDASFLSFLIYGENKTWNWINADCFVPLEDSMDENWWD